MIRQRKNRILIIDDNQDIHDDIKKILSPSSNTSALDALVKDISGYSTSKSESPDMQIDSALQGDEGVAMVRNAKLDGNPYALAFVDIRIPPGLDGVQTIKQLQQADECLQYVIITAYSDYSWENINTELSPQDNLLILKKPFEIIEIRQAASTLLEKWHLAHERNEAIEELIHSKKIETIGIMANGIAHDFNNLLMGIQGNIELAALDLQEDHRACESLERSVDIIQTTKKLIKKFLVFSDFNNPHKQATSIRDLITYAQNNALSESNVSCDFTPPENLWLVDVDPYQMSNALLEIFSNAREAMLDGGQLLVSTENVNQTEGGQADKKKEKYVRISIHDNGCGIQKKDLTNIYDPYYSTKPRGVKKGMGLGLALVAAIVAKHDGTVRVDSVPGEGTTVTVELPVSDRQLPE